MFSQIKRRPRAELSAEEPFPMALGQTTVVWETHLLL